MTPQQIADIKLKLWQSEREERAAARRFEMAARKRLGQRIFTLWLVACFATLIGIVLTVGWWIDPLRSNPSGLVRQSMFTCPEVTLPSSSSQHAKRKQGSFIQCASF